MADLEVDRSTALSEMEDPDGKHNLLSLIAQMPRTKLYSNWTGTLREDDFVFISKIGGHTWAPPSGAIAMSSKKLTSSQVQEVTVLFQSMLLSSLWQENFSTERRIGC